MTALNCLPQSPSRPIPRGMPHRGSHGFVPFRNPSKPVLGLPLPFPSFSPSKKPARAYGTLGDIVGDLFDLPDPHSDRPADDDYPERPGMPDHLKYEGWSPGYYRVTYQSKGNNSEEWGSVLTVTRRGVFTGVGVDASGHRYGLKSTDGSIFNGSKVVLGFGSSVPTFNPSDWGTLRIINIERIEEDKKERDPRRPYVRSPFTPLNPSPSQAIPPILSPQLVLSPQPGDRPVMPEPQPVPLSLMGQPLAFPSTRPHLPQLNPAQKPKRSPLLPFPIPPSVPYFPPSPTPPVGVSPSAPGTGRATGTGGATGTGRTTGGVTSTSLPPFPSGLKTPQHRPNLENAKNIKPEQEPCQCNLPEDEDYVIARIQQVQVPLVTQQGIPPNAIAVEKFVTVPVVAIKGVSNAGDVVQQYRVRADIRRTQIQNLNKSAQNFSAIGALTTIVNGINLFLNNQIMTKLNGLSQTVDKVWSGIKLLVNNPLIDRALSVITLIFAIHNATQLSTDIGFTVTETIDMGLNLVGFTWKTIDDEGREQELSTSEVIGNFWKNSIQSLIGAENFANLTIAWKKANRIYQATSGVLDAMQGISDAALQLNELTASMTGKIGNALKRAGLVQENAYEWFDENYDDFNEQSRKYPLFEKLERVQEGAQHIEEIVSSTVQVQESINELNESRNDFNETVKEAQDINSDLWAEEKANSEIGLDLSTLELNRLDEE